MGFDAMRLAFGGGGFYRNIADLGLFVLFSSLDTEKILVGMERNVEEISSACRQALGRPYVLDIPPL